MNDQKIGMRSILYKPGIHLEGLSTVFPSKREVWCKRHYESMYSEGHGDKLQGENARVQIKHQGTWLNKKPGTFSFPTDWCFKLRYHM
jgi:hypothetical protein